MAAKPPHEASGDCPRQAYGGVFNGDFNGDVVQPQLLATHQQWSKQQIKTSQEQCTTELCTGTAAV